MYCKIMWPIRLILEINKAIEDDPELETIAAKRKIAKYIELHDTNIAQKVEIIIEHFKKQNHAGVRRQSKSHGHYFITAGSGQIPERV